MSAEVKIFTNHGAKKHPATAGVCVLNKSSWITRLMQITDVGEVWGIGRRYAKHLNDMGIFNVYDFATTPAGLIRQKFGVVLERTCRELNGQNCLELDEITAKKQIVSSRSFSQRIVNKQDLSEALSGHVAQAGRKLRKQQSKCSLVSVFARNSPFNHREKYVSISGQYKFTEPTDDTRALTKAVQLVLENIYKDSVRYAKAGVMLAGICQDDKIQPDLFSVSNLNPDIEAKSQTLMGLMDKLNQDNGNQIFLASEGIRDRQLWRMSREFLSPCYTTRVGDVPLIN